jgi:hypothetical protein
MDANRNFSAGVVDANAMPTIGLAQGELARIENGRGACVRVESGTVWLTEHECTGDVILRAGSSHCIERDGLTLLTNFGARLALVTIEAAPRVRKRLGERLWAFWAALYAPQSRPTTAGL